jgi:signal transduction histidine kinase
MSIRLRLTLLYSVILALTLVAFSLLLYGTQAQYTLNVQKQDLELSTQRIALGLSKMYAGPGRLDRAPGMRNTDRPGAFGVRELRDLRVRDVVRVLDADGIAIDLPVNQEDETLPLSDEGKGALQNGKTWVEIVSLDGERWLIHNRPVIAEDRVVAIVQVGRTLVDRDRSVRALGIALTVGSLSTTLIAFGIGWALSGLTLRPIHRITQTARAIGTERDFGRRVQYTGPNDEVGQLATTFNAMLTVLQDAYQQVERSLAMQRGFVADVSHELRTPLTTIRGNLALLRREPPIQEEERADILADVVDESERLIRLVHDLLTLARADAGRPLQCERVPIVPLIEDVCRQARLLDLDREITCEPLLEVDVVADKSALKQVLLILLDNAIQHTEGPITVTTTIPEPGEIEVFPETPVSDGYLAIGVRDAGSGIEPHRLARIFERFYRGDEARSGPGFGLGLSIAKAIVEAQDGTVNVQSEVGRGSTFTVALPRAADE